MRPPRCSPSLSPPRAAKPPRWSASRKTVSAETPAVFAIGVSLRRDLRQCARHRSRLLMQPASSTFPLPEMGEVVPLPRIKEICAHYGLHALWKKIEADPP